MGACGGAYEFGRRDIQQGPLSPVFDSLASVPHHQQCALLDLKDLPILLFRMSRIDRTV